ncbi:MAG TPA: 16S rRNA (guanine(527)-N(7))-methyltransferase RsmG [Dongiaceae bacterium]|nr:16S rRNA (guanine(527)-N(7))-methyltransferase RsmG [Dongiaceae bacterium]
MTPARIAELLEPYVGSPEAGSLKPEAVKSILTYIDILQSWNRRINLTAIRNQEEILTRHFGESLLAARTLFPLCSPVSSVVKAFPSTNDRLTVADIGSGAGFPGIPIKLWAPQIHLTLIESNHKKSTFLREVIRALTLTDINIRNTRAESLAENFDVVTLRAVEHFESILPIAARLVAPEGRLALLIGQSQLLTARQLLPTLTWNPPIPIPGSNARTLAVAHQQASQESKE